jgi:hypothetical protein
VTSDSKTEVDLAEDDLRQVVRFATICARQVLPVVEAARPEDPRPREAIGAAEAFGAGSQRSSGLRASAWTARAAAREIEGSAAAHAAYAASHAAAAAYLHPVASPHQVKHILGAAVHQALVFKMEAGNDPATGAEHLLWAAHFAPPAVRGVLHRYPPPARGRTRFSELLRTLDAELRVIDRTSEP